MGLDDTIISLLMREGELKAQEGRERIAAEEEKRQSKHRVLKNTLKAIATFGPPLLLPGGPLAGLLGKRWAELGMSPFEKILIMSMQGGAGAGNTPPRSNLGTSPGRVPAGLGYTTFAGPMTRDDWYTPDWNEEGIG